MRCYNCGFEAEGKICPNCGAPLVTYRDIITLSAAYYNDGLDRAKSRDLSGAVRALQMCLKLDKNNIEARNLLGLIFYETGETVHSITQWVISKNLQPEENRVDRYLDELRNSPDLLDNMNRAIKKYNFALRCARKGNYDVARIQLKKVLQLNPRLLKARQLLSLLYIRRQDYVRARYELTQCMRIDACSDKTIRYQKEIDRVISLKNAAREEEEQPRTRQQAVAYQSGNDTIIQPAKGFSTGGALSLISVAIGIAVGVAATVLLVVPARERRAQMLGNDRVIAISEEADAKSVRLSEYEYRIQELEQNTQQMQSRLDLYEGEDNATNAYDALLEATSAYLNGETDVEALAGYMEKISVDYTAMDEDSAYTRLYRAVVEKVGPDVSKYYFDIASAAMRDNDVTRAAQMYELAARYDRENAEALYNYAEATRLLGDTEKAKLIYDQVVNDFPGTRRANDARNRIVELNN